MGGRFGRLRRWGWPGNARSAQRGDGRRGGGLGGRALQGSCFGGLRGWRECRWPGEDIGDDIGGPRSVAEISGEF
jgi:hypothetical protein